MMGQAERKENQGEIVYFDRGKGRWETEKVYGEPFLKWLYGSRGGALLSPFLIKAPLSRAYGWLQSIPWSKRKILRFVEDFQIDLEDYLPSPGRTSQDPYSSFNDFFIRKFKEGRRPFIPTAGLMPAFAEGRYLAYDRVSLDQSFPVKGHHMQAQAILQKPEWGPLFSGGPLVIARLCPVDYHRFHFPDDGRVLEHYRIPGDLHSVNPLALKYKSDIFCTNERQVTLLETKNFGKLAYVEVGAICVGRIVQSHPLKGTFGRGEEKGYFLFGGSTVIVLGEPGKWRPDEDLLQRSKQQKETFLKLGEQMAKALE